MAQNTLVVKLDEREQAQLDERMRAGTFEYRSLDHARFSARGEGVVATLYTSGKLVVQGAQAEVFAARYLEGIGARSSGERSDSSSTATSELLAAPDRDVIGSDETGKGDYLGPLVVAAVLVPAAEREALTKGGVTDSKRLTDSSVRKLAPALMGRYEHAVEQLAPADYNREHARQKNLNPMLADLHARAIERLAVPGVSVVVDQFAGEAIMRKRLAHLDLDLTQRHRAEREPAVAAASIVARFAFLEALEELGERWALDLSKGAGDPADDAARSFVQLHGIDSLGQVAKLHFKNTKKLPR